MSSEIKPIETVYKGYRFRSRLEARWAVFFDALGLQWEYEPEGFELGDGLRYLPDFLVRYPGRDESEVHWHWFEVKSDITRMSQVEWDKLIKFNRKNEITLLDGPPALRMYESPLRLLKEVESSFVKALEVREWLGESRPVVIDGIKPLYITFTTLVPYTLAKGMADFKRSGNSLWSYKGRMWWDEHDNFFSYPAMGGDKIAFAVSKALGARFEHGESGNV